MGSSSPDSGDDNHVKRSKKKQTRRSRSRSESRDRGKDRQRNKSKQQRRGRSRSASSGRDRSHRRRSSRSRSSDRSSRHRGSKRSSRSRSRSSSRMKRSDHHDSRSKENSRSYKKSSRNDSRESSKDSRRMQRNGASSDKFKTEPPEANQDATQSNATQQEFKLQMALRAAAAADDILRAQGVIVGAGGRIKSDQPTTSFDEQQRRATAINDIDSSEFVQASFKSTRSEIPLPSGSSVDASHAGAMFGSSVAKTTPLPRAAVSSTALLNADSLMHPNLYIGVEEKMERWKVRLMELRKVKLQSGTTII